MASTTTLVAQTPQYHRFSLCRTLRTFPSRLPRRQHPEILADVATIHRRGDGRVDRTTIFVASSIFTRRCRAATSGGRGRSSRSRIVNSSEKLLPRGSFLIDPRPARDDANVVSSGLLGGLAFSILLVYLLIVVNFQSWLDPFIIITALPAALAGIVCFCSSRTRPSACRR